MRPLLVRLWPWLSLLWLLALTAALVTQAAHTVGAPATTDHQALLCQDALERRRQAEAGLTRPSTDDKFIARVAWEEAQAIRNHAEAAIQHHCQPAAAAATEAGS